MVRGGNGAWWAAMVAQPGQFRAGEYDNREPFRGGVAKTGSTRRKSGDRRAVAGVGQS